MGGDLSPLRDALGHVGSGDLATDLRGAVAIQAEKEMLAEFRESRDPWGRAWAPVDRRGPKGGAGRPLVDTNQLRGSRMARAFGDGIEVGFSAPYALFQQKGTGTRLGPGKGGIRPREMLPMDGNDLGLWGKAFERVTDRIVRKYLGGQT